MDLNFPADRPLDVIPVGRVAIDFNPTEYFQSLVDAQLFRKYVGGSPANTAIGLARLGDRIGFIGKISNDRLGEYVLDVFKKEGIDTRCLTPVKGQEKLGLAFTEVISFEQSGILMYRDGAADLMLDMDDIDEQYVCSGKAVVISGTALTSGPSREACFKIMNLVRNNGGVLVFDIDYRPYGWNRREEAGIYFSLMAREADIIMGSREEFDLTESFMGADGTDASSAKLWFGRRAKLVVIKHGKAGSNAFASDGQAYRVLPFPVEAIKSTGGGDGYSSALLHGLLHGWNLHDCLEFGSASASMLVASHACSADMPTSEAVRQFIADSKQKHGEMVHHL